MTSPSGPQPSEPDEGQHGELFMWWVSFLVLAVMIGMCYVFSSIVFGR